MWCAVVTHQTHSSIILFYLKSFVLGVVELRDSGPELDNPQETKNHLFYVMRMCFIDFILCRHPL